MTKIKQAWLKRSLAMLLALVMCLSAADITAFATTNEASGEISNVTETSATLTVTNHGEANNPVVFYKIQDANVTAPTTEELKNVGTMLQDDSFKQRQTMTTKIDFENLTAGTDYVAYAVMFYEESQSYSNLVECKFTTLTANTNEAISDASIETDTTVEESEETTEETAESENQTSAVDTVIAMIAALTPVDDWSSEADAESAKAAQAAYEALSEDEKALVTNYAVLAEQMEMVAALEEAEVLTDTYTITINTSENGTVTADKETAAAADTVTLTVTPASGYALVSLTVTDADEKEITVTDDNTFSMPESNVTVAAEFVALVTISDENLRKEICEELGKEYAAGVGITQTEMESLTQLNAANAGITNITGLSAAVNLKSLNLSGNTGIYKTLTTLAALNSLETLDLSSCGFTESKNLITLLCLAELKNYSIANNDLVGYFTLPDSKVNVESLDLSGNLLTGVDGSYSKELYPNLKELNISKTLVVWNDSAEEYEDLVLNGVNVIHDEPQSKATLYRVLYEGTSSIPSEDADIDQETRTISFSILGDSVNVVFVSGAESDTSKVTIRDEKVTVLSYSDTSDKAKSAAMYRITGLTEGENSIPVTVMYLDGSTVDYTLKITSTKYNTNDEVYIKDAVVYKYLCKTLGKSYTEGYVITKEDLATIKNLTIPVCTDISWLQYCTKVQKVNTEDSVSDYMMLDKNASTYESVPDLSGLTALRELTLNSTNLKEVPDLSVLSGNSRFQKLYISATVDGKLPDVSSLSKLTTITVAHSKGDLPTGMASLTKLRIVYLMNNDSAEFQLSKDNLPSTLTTLQVSNEGATITIGDMTGIGQFDLTANYGGTDKFVFTAPDKVTFTLAYSEYKGASASFPTNMNELTGLKGFSLTNCKFDGAVTWNESFNNMTGLTSVAFNNSGLTEIPKWFETATNLTSIKVSNDNITQFDVDLSKHTALKTVDCSSLKLGSMPSADLLPTSLTTLKLSNQLISDFNVDYSKFTNLTKLEIQGNRIYEIPTFIKGISSLQELNISGGFYDEIQENAFGDLNNLTKLTVGNYLPVEVTEYPEWNMVVYSIKEGTTTANEIARLSGNVSANGKTLNVTVTGAVETTRFADLERVAVGDAYYYEDNGSFNIDLPSGTNQIALNAQAIYSGTTITLGDKTATGSGTFELELKEGYNEFTVKTHVDSVDARNPEGTDKAYTINIYVGEMSSIDTMETGHYYNVNCTILKANTQKESMAGGYFSDKAQIRKRVDGSYEIYLTCNKMSWVNDLATYDENGNRCVADIISQDEENDILKARVIMENIPVPFVMNMYVAPMGYYPNCDVYLDLTSLQDITDSMPAGDTADLSVAYNKATAITEKRNIYTEDSYSALTNAIAIAETVLANNNSSQEEIDEAKNVLEAAIEALVIDESKLADKSALKTAIDTAKALDKGNHTDTAWETLQEAIADAETVYNTLEASQSEVNAAAKSLNTAIKLFNSSGEASELDKNNLSDGSYTVYVDMIKADQSGKSMADNAINHTVKLEVIDGKYYITLDLQGITIDNEFGYLKNLSYYVDGYGYTALGGVIGNTAAATVLTTQKNADGSDVIDQYNDANTLYPDLIKFQIVPQAIKDTYVPLHVFVPVMEYLQAGNGDQDVLMKIDWTTLKAGQLNPTLSLDKDSVSLIAGMSGYNKATVTATLQNASGYTVSWKSSNEDVATVKDGVITAIAGGEATITCTATNGTNTLTKTVKVTVTGNTTGTSPVKVDSVKKSGTTATATMSGSVLVSQNTDGITLDGNTVIIDATSGKSGVKTANVVIPAKVADAFAASSYTKFVFNTDMGTVEMDAKMMAAVASRDAEVTLGVATASNPNSALYTAVYELTLTANGKAVSFGSGTATVKVDCDNEDVQYAYYLVDGVRKESRPVTLNEGTASFTTTHFSTWALSARELAAPEVTEDSEEDAKEDAEENDNGFFLKDGQYYVTIQLWKASSAEISMGNVAFANNSRALVTVKNGKITTVQVATNPVDVGEYHSAITSFKVTGSSVKVLSTGSVTTQPAGNTYTYIKKVSFNMPSSGQPADRSESTYVPVTFWVPDTPMDAAVGQTLYARLKFIWSTATSTGTSSISSNDATAAGTSSITGEEIKDVELKDEETGIKVETDTEKLSDEATLNIEEITSGADWEKAVEALGGIEDFILYSIKALVDGEEVAPTGTVQLSIPCENADSLVYRINDDGTKTLLKGEYADGYYVVNTTQFGLFAVVENEEAIEDVVEATTEASGETEEAGSDGVQDEKGSNAWMWAIPPFILLAAFLVFVFLKKRRNEEN